MSGRSAWNTDLRRTAVCACLVACSFAAAFSLPLVLPAFFAAGNARAVDLLFRARYRLQGRVEVSPYLINVVVGDGSRQALGLAAWDRKAFGRGLDVMQRMDARTVAWDVFLKEASFQDNDEPLLEATRRSGRAVFPLLALSEGRAALDAAPIGPSDLLRRFAIRPRIASEGSPPVAAHVVPPFPRLAAAAAALGHINCEPDGDGVNRRIPLLYRYGDGFIPALSLRAALEFLEVNPRDVEVSFGRRILLRGARVHDGARKDIVIPIDRQGRLTLDFVGPWDDSFRSFPLHRLLAADEGSLSRSQLHDLLEGAIVVVSDVSTASGDYGPGIFEGVYPLGGLHLTAVNSILTGNFLTEQKTPLSILTALAAAFLLWRAASGRRGITFPVFWAGLYAVFLVSCYGLFAWLRIVPLIAPPTLGFALTLASVTMYRVVLAERQRSTLQARLEASRALGELNARLAGQTKDLEAANEKLREMGQFKETFVQDVAHEFRTPLTLILDPLEGLLSGPAGGLPAPVMQDLGQMRRSARKLLQLVNQFLDLSRIEAGMARVSVRRADLTEFLRGQLALFEPTASRRGVKLLFKADGPRTRTYFDADTLEKIIANLLANALKSTEENGVVELSVLFPAAVQQHSRRAACPDGEPGQMIAVTVSDTGGGIRQEDLPFLFERFRGPLRPPKNGDGGSGIGLSLVRECVALHHGRITVQSERHKGTRVTVLLPWAREHFPPEEIAPESSGSVEPGAEGPAGLSPEEPVLLVDDESAVLGSYTAILGKSGISNLVTCADGSRVLPLLRERSACAVVLDLALPDVSGTKLLAEMKEEFPALQVLVVTGVKDVSVAVECIRLGASDYLVKPVEAARLVSAVRRCIEKRALEKEVDALSRRLQSMEVRNPEAFAEIVTGSRLMRTKFRYVEAIACNGDPVLITGESGVGKELVARAIHRLSGRQGRFVSENIAGLDDAMFTDTLFGHRKGAFTDAEGTRRGLVEEAKGGTLFLDEIGDMSPNSQVKLLRFIEDREYRPLGSDSVTVSDARIVLATNVDLGQRLEEGRFRQDLFYRLAHRIDIPPLRERLEDLPLLIDHFAQQRSAALGREKPPVPKELVPLLSKYGFPGNVRELKNMVDNALSRSAPGALSLAYFTEHMQESSGRTSAAAARGGQAESRSEPSAGIPSLRDSEIRLIDEALRTTGGNQNLAARLLGLSPSALSRRLKKRGAKKWA